MTKINVKYEPTCYYLEGDTWFCLHPDTKIITADFGYADPYKGDYVDDWREIQVCVTCGEEYNEEVEKYDEWRNVTYGS